MDEQPFMQPREVGEVLNVGLSRVYQLIRSREIPSVRIGGRIRVPRAAWNRWLGEQAARALKVAG